MQQDFLFALSKLAAPLLDPQAVLLLATGAGALLLFSRRGQRLGRKIVSIAAGIGLLLWIVPLGSWWLLALETTFPTPTLPERIDGIVVLGGDVDTGLAKRVGGDATGAGGMPRLMAAAELAHRHPAARIVYSGGSGNLFAPGDRDADAARPLLARLGVAPERVLFEDGSRNTHENATASLGLAQPRPDETWVLITTAFHMPRAVGCFRRAGWRVVALPVDRRADPGEGVSLNRSPGRRLGEFGRALKETIGLAVYRLLDRTDALWPAP